ncbi:putative tRNA dihydrouridine synthase [Papiliotrema laurentii]|uniref:tRNA-dihydrouridine(47) synthase [NAD(P)(+)] n=1 Tax=Papiliotrema laurentii TaxID=5418 RepID=A0AAD9L6N0_PAPLA|nr:putative tRNA dihydrouridine synthase [Papiliotrema laurentii]
MSDDPAATPRPETSLSAHPEPRMRNGDAPVKAEYLINPTPIVDSASTSALNNLPSNPDDDAEGSTTRATRPGHVDGRNGDRGDDRDKKRRKMNKKEKQGQNKGRSFPVLREASIRICRAWESTGVCDKGPTCKWAHSWEGYFAVKPADIHWEASGMLSDSPLYVVLGERVVGGEDEVGRTIDLKTECPVYKDLGYCPYAWRCRFLGGHVRRLTEAEKAEKKADDVGSVGDWACEGLEGKVAIDNEQRWKRDETNWPTPTLLTTLRTSAYPFPYSASYLAKIEPQKEFNLGKNVQNGQAEDDEEAMMSAMGQPPAEVRGVVDGESEASEVPMRPEEKRRLNWDNGLYLAPLTTVGNLPFRRLCVDYGATITISEMALAQPLVTGHNEEWALVRRHKSEKMFGVQVAGGYPNRMVPVAEMLAKEIGNGIDFVDVNLGCPIDLVFNQGAGSALLDNPGRLGKILVGMNRALGEVPLTVKFRTGVGNNKPNAHKLIPRYATEWGASAMTLHGRSRQQRYSKLADWAYIKQCADTLRVSLEEANMPPVPIFGNGDCFSAQGYYEEKEASGVDGIMVARGALIKPWIFTEIAERREWDISATERLEGIRKFAEFGLSHWGSDTQGVSKTRRFLCEALSFQHRYIPIGLLERLPPKLNERPPAYRGRNELETLLASPFAGDWVKISEMFLGKSEEGFNFIPKHKSNAYGGEESQG